MTLSSRLRNVNLTLKCELCGHSIVKKGGWFMTVSTFKCRECKGQLRLPYSDKVALFAQYAHLEQEKGEPPKRRPKPGRISRHR